MSIRQQKAIKQLKKCLGEYFITHNDHFDQLPSITKITISKDLKNASVYLYISKTLEDTQLVCSTLNKNAYSINQFMIKNVQFRVLPKLRFIPDKEQKEIDDITSILNNL